MNNKEIYILYIVLKVKGKLVKIGKTRKSNFKSRIYNIEKDFGTINYNKSFICYSSDEQVIDTLERLLHKSFDKDRKVNIFKDGVGKTEWFDSKIHKEILTQIKFMKKKNSNYKNLSSLKRMNGQEKEFFKSFLSYGSLVLNIILLASLVHLVLNKL